MAEIDNEPLAAPGPERHDGMAVCRMCATTEATAEHAWCDASGGLVCDDCCRRVLLGDVWRLGSAMSATDPAQRAEMIIASCLGCERGQRWYAEQLHRRISGSAGPC